MDSIVPRNRDQIISLFEYKFMSCSTLGKKKSLDFHSILFTTAPCYVMHLFAISFTLCTLRSVLMFSILFSIHFFRC